jgi:hypothetical protein
MEKNYLAQLHRDSLSRQSVNSQLPIICRTITLSPDKICAMFHKIMIPKSYPGWTEIAEHPLLQIIYDRIKKLPRCYKTIAS